MIDIVDSTEKQHEHENDDELQNTKQLLVRNGPIFRTEITVSVNGSEETSEDGEDLVILKDDHHAVINKSAYSKLHNLPKTSKNRLSTTSLSPYEVLNEHIINDNQSLNSKQLLAEETKSAENCEEVSKFPVPKFRHSAKIRNLGKLSSTQNPGDQDVNPNELVTKYNDDESNEFIPCVVRSESVDTIHKIEQELSNFVMDNNKKKEKKRTNSFRKLFSVSFFGKDKKKKEKESDGIHQLSSDYADNYQNETHSNSFVRNIPQRHTVGCDHFKNKTNSEVKPNHSSRTIEKDPPPEIMRQYANIHINKFNKIRQSFEYPSDNNFSNPTNESSKIHIAHNHNTDPSIISKYIDTSSSTSTLESQKQNTYQNALIAQAELEQVQQNKGIIPISDKCKLVRNDSFRRETPPRAQDTYQPVNIVKPKARLPINSGRPLPNPYQYEVDLNSGNADQELRVPPNMSSQHDKVVTSPQLNEVYGTVFDAVGYNKQENLSSWQSVEHPQDFRRTVSPIPRSPQGNLSNSKSVEHTQDLRRTVSPIPRSPRSPSLEMSKLRLPPNREILQPRVRSPLPPSKISTEKIIATELLKNANAIIDETDSRDISKSTSPEFLEGVNSGKMHLTPQAESTPESKSSVSEAINALRNRLEANDQNLKQELDQIRSTLKNLTHNDTSERFKSPNFTDKKDDILYGTNSPRSTLITSSRSSIALSPVPTTLITETARVSPNQRSFSQSSQEVELRQKNSIGRQLSKQSASLSPPSPSKDEIRRSVEAYYWKEIKKIKEREDYEIYLSQLQFSQDGYAEDPVCMRRNRGMEESRSRRSSSVPRNARQQLSFDGPNDTYLRPLAIPEGSTIVYNSNGNAIYGYLPPRNFQGNNTRSLVGPTASNSKRGTSSEYGTYKPIFRRGSLSSNLHQPVQMNKKVSFSNSLQPENSEVWPTKNGFTKSPPQRRIEKINDGPLEDDVFLSSLVDRPRNVPYQPIYGQLQRPLIGNNNYISDSEPIYGVRQNGDIYGYNMSQIQLRRPTNYNSDSEAAYGKQRQYKTLSQQDLENLRNSQTKKVNPVHFKHVAKPTLTRHESIQLPDPSNYGYAVQYGTNSRSSYRPFYNNREIIVPKNEDMVPHHSSTRRDILITDNIYGQQVGYGNGSVAPIYGYSMNSNQNISDPMYVTRSKQVTVRNKVCDMYGKIHDSDTTRSEIQATGVLLGQLQQLPSSPSHFRRGTRLTSSNNDVLQRRQGAFQPQNIEAFIDQPNKIPQANVLRGAPVRPLPPLPPSGKVIQNEKNTNSKKNSNSKKKKK